MGKSIFSLLHVISGRKQSNLFLSDFVSPNPSSNPSNSQEPERGPDQAISMSKIIGLRSFSSLPEARSTLPKCMAIKEVLKREDDLSRLLF